MYVDLKRFILNLAEKKEIKLHGYTIDAIDDAVRAIGKNKEITVDKVMTMLKKKDELRKEFGGSEWSAIEKEIGKMLK